MENAQAIVITAVDLDSEAARLLRKKERNETLDASTPESLEILVLCRRIAHILPEYDTVLFHGSALALDGNGVIFTARSGTGKSTHARLWRERFGNRIETVNDDKPLLCISRDGVQICGSPWRGKHRLGKNMDVPLKTIYFLRQSRENVLTPISPSEAFPLLLQQTFYPDTPEGVLQTLKLVERLAGSAALYRLECNMEPEAVETALEGLKTKGQKED